MKGFLVAHIQSFEFFLAKRCLQECGMTVSSGLWSLRSPPQAVDLSDTNSILWILI